MRLWASRPRSEAAHTHPLAIRSGLQEHIAADLASFDGLLATIPPKVYFPADTTDFNPSIKKRKTEEEAKAKRAAKKAKFDPNLPQTVPEILASRAAAAAQPKNGKQGAKQQANKQSKAATQDAAQANGSASVDELRDRLHAKMAALATQRKGANTSTSSASASPAPSSSLAAVGGREALLQESQRSRAEAKEAKRREKKLAKSNAAKEFKAAMEKAQSEEPVAVNGEAKGKGKSKAVAEPSEDQDWEDVASTASSGAPASPSSDNALVPSQSQAQNGADDIAFSSLDFKASDALRPVDVLPDLRRKPKKDAAMHALNRLEEREQFLSKLTPQARERAEEKDKWENAAKKASGEKVLDDATRLRKMTKKMEKTKDKSRQKWYVELPSRGSACADPVHFHLSFFHRQERSTEAKDKQAERQQKRNENVQKRIQAKRDRKNGVKPKKSKGGPSKKGFERSKPSTSSASSGGDKRGKHRGSVNMAQSKGGKSGGSRK